MATVRRSRIYSFYFLLTLGTLTSEQSFQKVLPTAEFHSSCRSTVLSVLVRVTCRATSNTDSEVSVYAFCFRNNGQGSAFWWHHCQLLLKQLRNQEPHEHLMHGQWATATLFIHLKILLLMHEYTQCVSVWVCAHVYRYPQMPEKGVRVPGVKRSCKPPNEGAGIKASILNFWAICLDPLNHLKLFPCFLKNSSLPVLPVEHSKLKTAPYRGPALWPLQFRAQRAEGIVKTWTLERVRGRGWETRGEEGTKDS